jgi:hypothetical protein
MTKSGAEKEPAAPTSPITFRIRDTLREELADIADYERALSSVDLVRTWIGEKVAEYHKDRRFLAFQEKRHPKGRELLPGQTVIA